MYKILESFLLRLNRALGYLRGFFYFTKFIYVGPNTQIVGVKNLYIGDGCEIADGVKLNARNGQIFLNNYTKVCSNAIIIASSAKVSIGVKSHIGEYTQIAAYLDSDISIGENTLIAPFNFIISSNHGISRGLLIQSQLGVGRKIDIGCDVWIAANCTILPGSTIENGSVIAAASLITSKTLPVEYGVFAGAPARLVKCRT